MVICRLVLLALAWIPPGDVGQESPPVAEGSPAEVGAPVEATIDGPDRVPPYRLGRFIAPAGGFTYTWKVFPGDVDIRPFDGGRAADVGAAPGHYFVILAIVTPDNKQVVIYKEVDFLGDPGGVDPDDPGPGGPVDPGPVAPAPPDAGAAVDPQFAGAVRMYLRGLPLGWRQVAGQVGANIKTDKDLYKSIEERRKLAANGMARRLAAMWVECFSATENPDGSHDIVNPALIKKGLLDSAMAAESGIK
jgi:hypothetical protein